MFVAPLKEVNVSADEDRKLFVAGLSDEATEASLRELFEAAGCSVQDISMPRDRATGKARGFSFVSMNSAEDAAQARDKLDGSFVDGRSISVRPFRSDRSGPPPGRPRGPESRGGPPPRHAGRPGPGPGPRSGGPGSDDATVYVGNLPFDATGEDVTEFFREAGFEEVRRVHLPTDPEGRRRGFGFVTLGDEEAARNAADAVNGASFRGRNLAVNLARRGGGAGPPSARPNQKPRSTSRTASFDDYPPPAPPGPPTEEVPARGEEQRRAPKKEKKKDKKRRGRGLTPERGAPKRRQNEEFHSSRAKDYIDDWEDD